MRGMVAALALGLCASASGANAGVYTDDLSRCLVKSASADDQKAFILWMYGAMSRHPAVRSYANFSEPQLDATMKQAAQLMQRLLTVDCRKETIEAIKYEGGGAMETAFGALGQAAMRQLISAPEVAKGLEQLGEYIDKAEFEKLGVEAGATPSAK